MAESIWSAPNFWNTAFSGFLIVGLPALLRFLYFRPRIHLSFHDDIDPDFESIYDATGSLIRVNEYLFSQLQVRNIGLVSLDDPRVWCISVKIKDSDNKFKDYPMTPFELNWSDTDKDYQVGAVFPGNFSYKINLLQINKGLATKNSSVFEATIPRRDRNYLKTFQLTEGLEHHLCIIISNNNFLVPAHFAHIKVMWKQDLRLDEKVSFDVQVLNQKDFYAARSVGETQFFESNSK